jgi:hypothetical protein
MKITRVQQQLMILIDSKDYHVAKSCAKPQPHIKLQPKFMKWAVA